MKLNPFTKKSTAYFDKVKADFNKLNQERAALNKQLASAQADYGREKSLYDNLCESAGRYSLNSTDQQRQQHKALSAANNRVGLIEGEIRQIDSRTAPLSRLVEAPPKFELAKQNLTGLLQQQAALTAELEKTDTLIAKVNKRVTEVEARIASETVAASQTLIDGEGEFTFPEALSKLEMELRLGKTTLADLQKKRDAITAQRQEMPAKIRDEEGNFVYYRAVVAEIELHEQILPVMDLFVRAAVTRHQRVHSYDQNQFEIEIPRELIEPVEAALAAEIPRA